MDYNDSSWARPFLNPGESIRWVGRPENPKIFQKSDVFMIPFSLVWCGGIAYWEYVAITSGAPVFFMLFGAVGVAVGLYILIGRFIWRAYVLKHSAYAITTFRILRNRRGKTDVLMLNALPPYTVETESDGRGSILFQTAQSSWSNGYSMKWRMPAWDDTTGFSLVSVPNIRRVLSFLRPEQDE